MVSRIYTILKIDIVLTFLHIVGGLYAILLSSLTKGLLEASKEQDSKIATAQVWARGLEVSFFFFA